MLRLETVLRGSIDRETGMAAGVFVGAFEEEGPTEAGDGLIILLAAIEGDDPQDL